jgi:hypothetical protein
MRPVDELGPLLPLPLLIGILHHDQEVDLGLQHLEYVAHVQESLGDHIFSLGILVP